MSGELSRDELSATVAARQELGHEYEPALVDALAERVEQVVQGRVRAELQARPAAATPTPVVVQQPPLPAWARVSIAGASLTAAIPCTILAAIYTGVAGVAIVWVGVAIVNLAAGLPRSFR
jgi:hypothetical protein